MARRRLHREWTPRIGLWKMKRSSPSKVGNAEETASEDAGGKTQRQVRDVLDISRALGGRQDRPEDRRR